MMASTSYPSLTARFHWKRGSKYPFHHPPEQTKNTFKFPAPSGFGKGAHTTIALAIVNIA